MADVRMAPPERLLHEFDAGLLDRELIDFHTELADPIVERDLHNWIGTSAIRRHLFANSVFGTIRWKKSLGKPLATSWASAFVIDHEEWQRVEEDIPGGKKVERFILIPHDEPPKQDSKRDGVRGDEYHYVNFRAAATEPKNRISVRFVADVGWELKRPGYRDIQPAVRAFTKGEGPMVLEPFEVVLFEKSGDDLVPPAFRDPDRDLLKL